MGHHNSEVLTSHPTNALSVEEMLRYKLADALVEASELRDELVLLRAELTIRTTQKASLELRLLRIERELGVVITRHVEPRFSFEAAGVRDVTRSLDRAREAVRRLMGWKACVLQSRGEREWSCYASDGDMTPPADAPRIVRLPSSQLGAE